MGPNNNMPVSVVCDSSISSAIHDSLSITTNTSAYNGPTNSSINAQVAASVKRVILSKIEYEEAPPNFGSSMHDELKAKYTFLNGNVPPSSSKEPQQSAGTCSTILGKDGSQIPAPKLILFPRENVQIGWKSSGHKWQIGAGMMNVGNTCYLNSTLQALFHVPAFANWLISDDAHRATCEDNTGSQGGCIVCAMAKTLISSQKSHNMAIKPFLVYSKLRLVCRRLVPGHQEDAHEFLRYLMEAMEKAYLSRYKNSKEFDQYTNETTPINQILGGYLKSSVRCLTCGHVSVTFQHFEDLLLDIRKANSIEEALDVHFARERLEDMGYKCEACKKKVSATKQFSLERPPVSLCVQLKRFSMMGGKLNKQVTIRQKLDLSDYSSRKTTTPLVYRLVAMVTHLGASQHCGHYTAIGLTDGGGYYQFDDSCVRPISLQNVLNTNAYIVFYELEDGTSMKHCSAPISSTITSKVATAISAATDLNDTELENKPKSMFGTALTNCDAKTEKQNRFIGPLLPQQRPVVNGNGNKCLSLNGSNGSNLGSKLVNNNNANKTITNGHSTNANKSLGMRSTLSSSNASSSIIRFKPSAVTSPKKDETQPNRLNENNKKASLSPNISIKITNNEHKSEVSNGNKSPLSPSLPSMPKLDSPPINNSSPSAACATVIQRFNLSDSVTLTKTVVSATATVADNPKSLVPYSIDGDDSDSNSMPTGSGTNCDAVEKESPPPSPPVIKTNAGVWKVSTCNNETFGRNVTTKTGNQFNNGKSSNYLENSGSNIKRSSSDTTVNKLQKLSHMGYGAQVNSWNGQSSRLVSEINAEKHEERKRAYEDLDEMDRGNVKKPKLYSGHNNAGRDNPGYNPFTEHQSVLHNRNRWQNNMRPFLNFSNRQNSYHNSFHNYRGKRSNRNGFNHQRGGNNRYNRNRNP